MREGNAPPLLWLLVPTGAAVPLDHVRWTHVTFELRAISEPPEEEWAWALTTLRVPFDVTSQALVHAAPYLLRMLRVVSHVGDVGVRGLTVAAQDLGRLVAAIEAKVAILTGEAADGPPPAQRRRLEGPSQADARPVLTPKAPYLDWRALRGAALTDARTDGGMRIVPDPTRTRAVWMAREHLPASLLAMMLQNDHLKDELSRTKLELAHARVQYPSTWQLQSNDVPVQGLIDVPQGSAEFNEREQLLQAKLPGANLLQLRRVQNQGLYCRYFFERKLTAERHSGNANERQLWMSSGSTPPDVLCNSAHGVDPMFYLQGGSYGVAAYFAEDPLYSHFIRPCPAQQQEGFQLILAQVVLGDVKEFGSAMGKAGFDNGGNRLAIGDLEQEPFKEDGSGQFDSWTGTEGNMQWLRPPLARCCEHPREVTENGRKKRTPWYSSAPDCDGCRAALAQCQAMMADGPRYGRQYMIARFQKAYPQYVLRYSLSQ